MLLELHQEKKKMQEEMTTTFTEHKQALKDLKKDIEEKNI